MGSVHPLCLFSQFYTKIDFLENFATEPAQLQSISDNMSDLNYDEILFRSDILLRSIELITLMKRIEPEDFDEMINGYAEVLRFYAEELKKLSTIHVHDCMKINQTMLKMLVEKES